MHPPLLQQHRISVPWCPQLNLFCSDGRRKNPRLYCCCSGGSAAASALSRLPARSLGAGAAFQSSYSSKWFYKGLFRLARIRSITSSVVKSLWRISDQGAYSLKVFGKAISTFSLLQLVKLITLECLLLPQLLCVPGIFALLMQALQPLGV